MTITVRAIPGDVLEQLRRIDDNGQTRPTIMDAGKPLRCCLRKSRPEERIQLVSYAPVRRWGTGPGAYDEAGPVFIHAETCDGPETSAVPDVLRGRRRVCRAYDAAGRILGGTLVDNKQEDAAASIEQAAKEWFAAEEVAAVHVRAVEFGCFYYEIVHA